MAKDFKPTFLPNSIPTVPKLRDYVHMGMVKTYPPKSRIEKPANYQEVLLFTLSGYIKTTMIREDGTETLFIYTPQFAVNTIWLHTYDHYMEHSLILSVVKETTVCYFSKEQIMAWMQQDWELLEQMIQQYAANIDLHYYKTLINTPASATKRMLQLLYNLCTIETPDENGWYRMPILLSQRDLADTANIHYATANRIFRWLEKEKVVKKTRKQMIIYDFKRLEHLLKNYEEIIYY